MSRAPSERYPRTLRRTVRREVEVEPEQRSRPRLKTQSAPLLLLAGFAATILIGAVLLSLPFSSQDRDWTSPIVSLFVATSAVCVTGLTPVDTGTYWSGFGQGLILVLCQLGGLGFMAGATLLFLVFGWRVGLRERLFLSQTLDLGRMGGVVRLIRRAAIFSFAAEGMGTAILFLRFLVDDEAPVHALWHAAFISVSAFNNAGFDLFGDFRGLTASDDAITLAVVAALAFLGGIGFLVIEDLRMRKLAAVSIDTKIVLRTTAALVGVAFVLLLLLEWENTLAGRSTPDKFLQTAFHAIASRTAGFATVSPGDMTDEAAFLLMGLMFIGGASGSTAGGIKVGTFGILIAAALSAMAGREHVEAAGREIRRVDVDRALAVALLAVLLVFAVSLVLARLESAGFLDLMFEATSAFGTTGLSRGITPELSDAGLLVVTATMFLGRLGPLSLALALVQRTQGEGRRLPEERVRIG
jgi:trk system potassium uptake protein TrkH